MLGHLMGHLIDSNGTPWIDFCKVMNSEGKNWVVQGLAKWFGWDY